MTFFRGRPAGALFCCAVGLASVACGSSPGDSAAGELGAGTFDYICVVDGDAMCSETDAVNAFQAGVDFGKKKRFPSAVAVGSYFGLEYAGTIRVDGDTLLVTVAPASREDEVAPDVFALSQPTEAAFIATDSRGVAADFVVVEALEATSLSVWSEQEDVDRLKLKVDDSTQVTVVPVGKAGTLLAGALPYVWQSSDESVVAIGKVTSEADSDRVKNVGDIEVRAIGEGTATLTVSTGALEKTVKIEVTK